MTIRPVRKLMTRRFFGLKLAAGATVAAGGSLALGGCGDTALTRVPPADAGIARMDATHSIDFVSPDLKVLSLSDRLDQVLNIDKRFQLYIGGTQSSTGPFLSFCKTNFGDQWTTSIVVAIERAANAIVVTEKTLKDQFNVSMFTPEIRLRVGANELQGCIAGKADPLFLCFWPPKPSGCSTKGLYLPAAAHEYGHFLSFYDPGGKQVIPTYKDPPQTFYKKVFDLEMAEMAAKGHIERYHLGKIKYIPLFSATITQIEWMIQSELVANKVAVTLFGNKGLNQLLASEFEASFTAQQMGNMSSEILLAYLFYCDKYKITKWSNIFRIELAKRGTLSQTQITSALAKQDQFYNSVQLLNY
ncbi:MAG: hypothetical protein HQ564_07205 [Candidatus Saganbacteria bacterium]|nr:hypothetical protein [Candidatus Saganbacteria bacterium]